MVANVRPQARPPRRSQRYPDPIPLPPADTDAVDYWEEVALARLRLARLALIVTLSGTAILAFIVG
ncbi:MAG: hypothetical protein RLO51_28010 [Thalassobaculum sp.]|uniref:hypothetical protein n=1 Tax=Thalassobaculum sp. TaxID=2022740 RepID=UPI0032EC3E2D